ncbi:GerMN domain-containing protein [Catellatospora sp. NPDC049133]|uniref:GerMN domain-containing protein n=1 Tax=Catellatospora sp. NPDC049133 TaxID=3155499 RepID=UPI0033C1D139
MSALRFRVLSSVALVALTAACTPTTPSPDPTGSAAPSASAAPGTTAPSPSAPTSTEEPAPPAGTSGALAVYYLANDRGEPKLVREFHRLSTGDGSAAAKVKAAVAEMLDGRTAYDPDYSSMWPASARVRGVSVSGDTVTVDLSGARINGDAGSFAAHQAVQQLVWTATAVSGKPKVRIHLDGKPVDELWGHVGTKDPLRRAPAATTLLPVWLIDPQEGATVPQDFTLHVAGMVFEATMNYEVRRGSTVVREGFITLDAGGPAQGEAKLRLSLPTGTYVIEVFDISENDGAKMFVDNHTVTVK